jgi:hypothetical protein
MHFGEACRIQGKIPIVDKLSSELSTADGDMLSLAVSGDILQELQRIRAKHE